MLVQGPREDSGFSSAIDPGQRLASQVGWGWRGGGRHLGLVHTVGVVEGGVSVPGARGWCTQ
jgi:hypothetical protein